MMIYVIDPTLAWLLESPLAKRDLPSSNPFSRGKVQIPARSKAEFRKRRKAQRRFRNPLFISRGSKNIDETGKERLERLYIRLDFPVSLFISTILWKHNFSRKTWKRKRNR